jgi:hypothetical protein
VEESIRDRDIGRLGGTTPLPGARSLLGLNLYSKKDGGFDRFSLFEQGENGRDEPVPLWNGSDELM